MSGIAGNVTCDCRANAEIEQAVVTDKGDDEPPGPISGLAQMAYDERCQQKPDGYIHPQHGPVADGVDLERHPWWSQALSIEADLIVWGGRQDVIPGCLECLSLG